MRRFFTSETDSQTHGYMSFSHSSSEPIAPRHGQSTAPDEPSGQVSSAMFPLMEIGTWELTKPEPDERNPYEYFTKYLGPEKTKQIPVNVMDVFMLYWEANIFPWSRECFDPWCIHWWFDDVVDCLKGGDELRCYYRTQDIETDRPIKGMFAYYGNYASDVGGLHRIGFGPHISFKGWDIKNHFLRELIESSGPEGNHTFLPSNPMDLHQPLDFYLVAYSSRDE